MIAWSSTRKVTALPSPCLSSVCAGAGARHSESGCPGAPAATNRRCRGAARPREPRGAGEGEGAALSVGLGAPGARPEQKQRVLILVLFFFFITPPCVFFSSRKPTWRYFSKARCIFHPATAAWFCQAPFLLRSSFKGKKIRSHGSPNALSYGVLFYRHTLCF